MAKNICPNCGKKVPNGALKCKACGTALICCPACGSQNVSANNGMGKTLVAVAFGALGASMMKKYVCNDCKTKF